MQRRACSGLLRRARERRGGQLQADVEFSFAVFPDLRRFSRQAKVVRRLLWGAPTDWGPVPGCCAIRTRLALPRKYDPKSSVIYSLAKGQAISRMPAVPQSGVGREPEDHAIFAIAWSNRKLLLDRTCKIHRASRTGGTCSVASASVEGQRSSCSTI